LVTVTICPGFGTTFEIDDPAVAVVDVDGVISSVAVGTTSLIVSNGLDEVVPVHVERIPCPSDVTDDGVVNVEDLLELVADWGALRVVSDRHQ
jgi:hypothetical protein